MSTCCTYMSMDSQGLCADTMFTLCFQSVSCYREFSFSSKDRDSARKASENMITVTVTIANFK